MSIPVKLERYATGRPVEFGSIEACATKLDTTPQTIRNVLEKKKYPRYKMWKLAWASYRLPNRRPVIGWQYVKTAESFECKSVREAALWLGVAPTGSYFRGRLDEGVFVDSSDGLYRVSYI